MTEMLDEQTEARIAPDGTVTVRLAGDETAIRQIEFAQLVVEFADAESLWRSWPDYRAREKADVAEEKMAKMFTGERRDSKVARAYARFVLLLLYMRKIRPEA